MTDLAVRGDALQREARRVRTIAADLVGAHAQAEDAAAAVGHRDLARTVRDFGSRWDIHRQRLIDEITALADTFDAINDTLADLESGMASQLTDATVRERATTPLRAAKEGGDGWSH